MSIEHISKDVTTMTMDNGKEIELLWGDRARVISQDGATARVRARDREGTIDASALGGESLLEFYFIDVGQGDGVLIRTPDDRHIMIDGGWKRASQPTGKNAADFVDWKFVKDYERQNVELDTMIVSHNDADHYGGLWDLLNPDQVSQEELDAEKVTVEQFFHAGVAWWKKANGRWLGVDELHNGERFFTQLMGNRQAVENVLQNNIPQSFNGEWKKFMQCVADTKRRDGQPTPIERLSHPVGGEPVFLPGFAPADDQVSIKVLAPVEHQINGKPGVRKYPGGDDKSTNGNSVLLCVEYKNMKVLLTGDLNTGSQRSLLTDYEGQHSEFLCDIAKCCHHGSDDVSLKFLRAMKPAVTVISSGDNNGHDHPRPSIVGASAVTGFEQADPNNLDRLISPLIYSTELARSLALGRPDKLSVMNGAVPPLQIVGVDLDRSKLECLQVDAGALQGRRRVKNLNDRSRMVTDLIYGLVNVRTDGEKILCATLNETKYEWDIKTLNSRF